MTAIIAEMLRCLEYDVPFIIKGYNFCAKGLSLTANSFYWFYFSILENISTLTIIGNWMYPSPGEGWGGLFKFDGSV